MKSFSRKGQVIFFAAAVLCLGIAVLLYLLQSNWLKENIRHRIIAAVQNTTGGQVELKSFLFDWRLLTAEMNGFVLHGTEPRENMPLFQADSVRVRLRITSFLKRDVRIAALQVEAPKVYLLLRPDGTTNIPGPQRIIPYQLTEQLLQLKLQRVSLNHGLIQVNDERIPLDLTAHEVALALAYNHTGPHYVLHFASPAMNVAWAKTQEMRGSIQASAQLAQNQLTLTKAILHSGDSQIELSGSLHNFAQPAINWNIRSQLAAPELAAALHIANLKSGMFDISGSGYWDAHTPLSFRGEFDGQHLTYLPRKFPFKNVSLKSKLEVDGNTVRLPDLDLTGPGIQWKGKAELTHDRTISLRGELTRLDLQTAMAAAGIKNPGWSAVVRGPVDVDGLLRPQLEDFTVKAGLQLSPASGSSPLWGNLTFAYRQRSNLLELGDSRLHLPGTEIAMAGVPGTNLKVLMNSTNLSELRPLLALVHTPLMDSSLPVLLRDGTAHFDGSISGNLSDPQIAGILALTNFQWNGANWQRLHSSFNIGRSHLALSSFTVQQDSVHGRATGQIALTNWSVGPDSALRLEGQFSNLDIKHIAESPASGLANGIFALNGTVSHPTGDLQIQVANFGLWKEHLQSLAATVKLKDGQLELTDGKGTSGSASVNFTGTYQHEPGKWDKGILSVHLRSDLFPISNLLSVRQSAPDLSIQTKIDLRTTVLLTPNHFQLRSVDGSIALRNIAVSGIEYGNLNINASTHGPVVESSLEGNLRSSRLWGTAQLQLTPEMPMKAQLQFGQTDLQVLAAVFRPAYTRSALAGSVRGDVMLEGPLLQWEKMRAAVKLEDLQISSPDIKKANLILHNSAPVSLQAANGTLTVQSMKLSGRDTDLSISGTVPLLQNRTIQLKVDGVVDLHLAELFYPNLQSSGGSNISAVLGGTLNNPTITGTTEFRNGRVSLNNFPNELTDLNGTIQFDQNRATLQNVTAHSGGGNIALSGFVTFSAGHSLVYRLDAASQDVRIRYANGISITGSSQLALTGTSQASVLSGTATISRIIFNPNADVGALLASTVATGPIGVEPDFLSGLQFDIHVDSAPNLQLSTSLSRDMQAAIDLQLRGNPKNPVLLGSIEANEGDIRVFGSRYSINRGQISFTNPAKIEPVLDLDLRTQTRGINVDITVSGTMSKLNINYRSDPPLQPRDIIALLAVGRAPSLNPSTPNTQLTNNDIGALQPGANTVLGQAVSPNSSRLQKLFGIANIKIDPLVQGITNTSQARLTLEQQISRQITVTYVTNLSQTSEQIFRLEYALNPQFSLIALRDDNGEFGLDILYKKRFK